MQHLHLPTITIIREAQPRASWDHTCSACGQRIPRGEQHNYFVYTDDETTYRNHRFRIIRTHTFCPRSPR